MKRYLLLPVMAALLSGCAAHTYTVHPGAINTFDSQTYDALYTADQAIQQAKTDVVSGSLPAAAKGPLNTVIASYDIADAAWLTYHDAGANAANATAMQAALTQDLSQLAADITALKSASGGKIQ